jgi:hypothetical protein
MNTGTPTSKVRGIGLRTAHVWHDVRGPGRAEVVAFSLSWRAPPRRETYTKGNLVERELASTNASDKRIPLALVEREDRTFGIL